MSSSHQRPHDCKTWPPTFPPNPAESSSSSFIQHTPTNLSASPQHRSSLVLYNLKEKPFKGKIFQNQKDYGLKICVSILAEAKNKTTLARLTASHFSDKACFLPTSKLWMCRVLCSLVPRGSVYSKTRSRTI